MGFKKENEKSKGDPFVEKKYKKTRDNITNDSRIMRDTRKSNYTTDTKMTRKTRDTAQTRETSNGKGTK